MTLPTPSAVASASAKLQRQQQEREWRLQSLERKIALVRKQIRDKESLFNRTKVWNEERDRQSLERLRTQELDLMREQNDVRTGRSVSPTPTPFPTPDL